MLADSLDFFFLVENLDFSEMVELCILCPLLSVSKEPGAVADLAMLIFDEDALLVEDVVQEDDDLMSKGKKWNEKIQ